MKKLLDKLKIGTLASMISFGGAQSAPIIEITNSSGEKTNIDCNKLIIAPKKNGKAGIYMSCDFAEQLNPDGKNICNHTDEMPRALHSVTRKDKYKIAQATIDAVIHFGRAHGDCVSKAATIDMKSKTQKYSKSGLSIDEARKKAISEVNTLYGKDWKSKKSCTLKEAVKQCSIQMDLD